MKKKERDQLDAEWRAVCQQFDRLVQSRPPYLCAQCVWMLKDTGRLACPFSRCVRKSKGWPEQ